MNQPHNPIRPRRRQPMVTAANPVMARPEQSTRILIRVPAVASGATASTHAQVAVATSATSGKKLSAAPQIGAKLPEAVTAAVLAEVKWSGADSAQPSETPVLASKSHRIDAGHLESLRPHLAETKKSSWNWWTDPSQRRAMIAVALIVGAVVVIAIMLHNESQHRTMQAKDDRNVKGLQTEVKESIHSPQATGLWNGQGQNAVANRPVQPTNGFTSSVGGVPANQAPIGNPAMGQGQGMSGPQYRAADTQNNYSGTAPNATPWKMPAGSNMPARVDPIHETQPPASGPSQQAPPETVLSAQRGSLPFGVGGYQGGNDYRGGDYRATGGQPGAAFNGPINNQISR